jgi:peptide/nickel transport system substrate-binding protein
MVDPCARAILINCDPSKGILADHRMRWVVSLLLDREHIAKSIWEPATTAATYPWTSYDSMKKWELPEVAAKYPLEYDPKRAAELLDEMGARKGSDGKRRYKGKKLDFTIINPGPNTAPEYQVGQLLVKELEKLGIDANLHMIPTSSVYTAAVAKGDYDMRAEWGVCSVLDPYQTYRKYDGSTYEPIGKRVIGGGNDVRLKSEKLGKLVGSMTEVEPGGAEAERLYEQALEEWYTQMPVVPYIDTIYTHHANTTYWTGWPTNDDLYQPPNNWWGNFMFVIGEIAPTGKK